MSSILRFNAMAMVLFSYYYNRIEIDYRMVATYYEKARKLGNIKASIGMADYWFNAGFDDDKGEEILLNLLSDDILNMNSYDELLAFNFENDCCELLDNPCNGLLDNPCGKINVMLKLAQFYNSRKRKNEMTKFIILALKCGDNEINYENFKIVENAVATLKFNYKSNVFKEAMLSIKNPNRIVKIEISKLC